MKVRDRVAGFALALALVGGIVTQSPLPAYATAHTPAMYQLETWQQMQRHHMLSPGQFGCILRLWDRESGWNKYAYNPNSGAYGLPQALPGGKMASAGRNWRTSAWVQIRWGLRYIRSRYATACRAWEHEVAYGWY